MSGQAKEAGLVEGAKGARLTAPCWWCSLIFPALCLLLVLVALILANVS